MRAIAIKEFRQLRRDRRTLAVLFLLPFLFLVVFGYAASFDIKVGRGVMVRGAPIGAPWVPLGVLAVMAVVVFTASTLRFRRDLAPAGAADEPAAAPATRGAEAAATS